MITRYKRNKFLTLLKEELVKKAPLTYRKWSNAINRVENVMGFSIKEVADRGALQYRGIPTFCPDCHSLIDYDYCLKCSVLRDAVDGMRRSRWLTNEFKLTPKFRADIKMLHNWSDRVLGHVILA
jgi:hypothetical protein